MTEERHSDNPCNLNPAGSWPRTDGAGISIYYDQEVIYTERISDIVTAASSSVDKCGVYW